MEVQQRQQAGGAGKRRNPERCSTGHAHGADGRVWANGAWANGEWQVANGKQRRDASHSPSAIGHSRSRRVCRRGSTPPPRPFAIRETGAMALALLRGQRAVDVEAHVEDAVETRRRAGRTGIPGAPAAPRRTGTADCSRCGTGARGAARSPALNCTLTPMRRAPSVSRGGSARVLWKRTRSARRAAPAGSAGRRPSAPRSRP